MDVLEEGLAQPLPAIMQIPRVTRSSIGTLEVLDEGRVKVSLALDGARTSSSNHALAKLDRSRGR